jgi:hypothetical protein
MLRNKRFVDRIKSLLFRTLAVMSASTKEHYESVDVIKTIKVNSGPLGILDFYSKNSHRFNIKVMLKAVTAR